MERQELQSYHTKLKVAIFIAAIKPRLLQSALLAHQQCTSPQYFYTFQK